MFGVRVLLEVTFFAGANILSHVCCLSCGAGRVMVGDILALMVEVRFFAGANILCRG